MHTKMLIAFPLSFMLYYSKGRPKTDVSPVQVREMFDLGFTVSQMATRFNLSRPTVYKLLSEAGIEHSARFTGIDDTQLDRIIAEIKEAHPNAGEINVIGHLRARKIRVQRNRVRASIHRVDPQGPAERSSRNFHPRLYETPCPNYVWHLDGNHKLVKWGFVTHLAIDGFSRLITFGETSDNNKADTVIRKFMAAITKYGRPLCVRTDHGGENVEVWRHMIHHQGPRSIIAGTSVRNQRVERLNGDVNVQVNRYFAETFRELEFEEKLDITNSTDKFCLHYVYLPRINKTLADFVNAHNCHSISTEGSATPRQLMFAYRHLTQLHHSTLHSTPYPSVSAQELLRNPTVLPYVEVLPSVSPLPDMVMTQLRGVINPLAVSADKGKDIYMETVKFVGDYLTNSVNSNVQNV